MTAGPISGQCGGCEPGGVDATAPKTEGVDVTAQLDGGSRLTCFRSRHVWLDHVICAGERYTQVTRRSAIGAAVGLEVIKRGWCSTSPQ
jgi:hypothetical protein